MKKLIKIQEELKAPKNQRNNFGKYNYRSCEDILEAVKPHLAKQGLLLTITDEIKECLDIPYVEATATITDGETVRSVTAQAGIDVNRKGMDVAQTFGASSSYARKYALNGLFLIDDTKDADTVERLPNITATQAKEALKLGMSLDLLKKKYTLTKEQEEKYKQQLNQK